MPKTLLLADDSVTIQKVVGITFANEDVDLVTVDNGDDALVRARELMPDGVLADVSMPGLDGYALCSEIKRDPALANIPVMLLTGTFEPFDETRAGEVGADSHISKPFEAQVLVDQVRSMLERATSEGTARPTVSTPAEPELGARSAPEAAGASAPPAIRTINLDPEGPDATRVFTVDPDRHEEVPELTLDEPAFEEPSEQPAADDLAESAAIAEDDLLAAPSFLDPERPTGPGGADTAPTPLVPDYPGDARPAAPSDDSALFAVAPPSPDAPGRAPEPNEPFGVTVVQDPDSDSSPPTLEALDAAFAESEEAEAEDLPWLEPVGDDEPPALEADSHSAPAAASAAPPIDADRVREALEKVAWEAFGPLSEQLVREVVSKVEQIAWEVIPQLTEQLIREEIERLKAETPED